MEGFIGVYINSKLICPIVKLKRPTKLLNSTTERCYHLMITVTCNIVSKLKVSPFHKVNSPLEAPVTNRLPSGVHWERKENRLYKATNPQS